MFEYKGYIAKLDYNDDDEYIHGEVVNISDVITFKGKTVAELKRELKNSVECYLDFCKKKNKDPDKPFSGKFIIRIAPDLHRDLYISAKMHGLSLNKWIAMKLESSVPKQH